MNPDQWKAVDSYFGAAMLRPDPAHEAVTEANGKAGLPAIDVSPLQGKFLSLLTMMQGARRVLEFGTLGGYSTIWFAKAVPADGLVVTLEVDPKHAEVATENIRRAGCAEKVRVVVGPALDTLPQVARQFPGAFDFIFIDADKVNTLAYFEWSLTLSHPGTVIVIDNVARKGDVIDAASSDPSVVGMRRMVEALEKENRVVATAIQTVGVKGYDGFILARVK